MMYRQDRTKTTVEDETRIVQNAEERLDQGWKVPASFRFSYLFMFRFSNLTISL